MAFAERVTEALDAASLALLLSLGHQSGLFDALATLPEPATSTEIASRTGLNERYVREWLGGTTVAGVVDYDAATKTYRLPQHHAAVLTRAAGAATPTWGSSPREAARPNPASRRNAITSR